jgi:ligand-binding sensor domain-containing protein
MPLAITQDREGLLWLATPMGIVRFDGLHFEPLRPSADIDLAGANQIAASPDGSIWIGTPKGLIRYREGRFTKEIPGAIPALIVTHAGRVLAGGGPEMGLYICTEPGLDRVRWSRVSRAVTGKFHEDLEGNTWFGCGVSICSWSDTDVTSVAAENRIRLRGIGSEQRGLSDVVATPDHRIWARKGPDIVLLADGRIMSRAAVPVETFHGTRPGFFLDRRGCLWIPGRKLHVIENGVLREVSGAPLDDVTAVFQDRQSTLWFGLAGKGLAAIPDPASLESWSETEGIFGSVLDLAMHPRLGTVAATNAGAYVFDSKKSRWQALGPPGQRTAMRSLAAGSVGDLLSLPNGRGLSSSTAPFSSARALALPPDLKPGELRKLYRDPQGGIWICALLGLFKMDMHGRIVPVPLPGGRYPSDVWMDSGGQLWVGYEGGIARCSGESCTLAIAQKDGLLDPRIRTIAPGDGEVWVGYRASIGFTRFQLQQGRWVATHFNAENGFGPSDTHFLRRDRRGRIWRGSSDGVYVSDGKHTGPEDWIHLTFGDRVNASYANMYGFLEDADGSIWIGTQKGVVRIHPAEDWFKTPPPRIGSMPSPARGGEDLEIHIAQPELSSFQSRLFRYRLLPADKEWRFSSDGTLRYPRLRAGAYRLQLAAGGGRPPIESAFTVPGGSMVAAPLWILIALLGAGGLGWILVRRRRSAHLEQSYWEEKRHFLESRDSAETEDWSGRTLDDRFLLDARVAGGGFASVYRARDQANGAELVAVKVLHALRDHEEWRRRRFAEEVAALQKLDHPGAVRIRHAGEAAPDQPYLVTEFIEGVTLRELLAGGPLEFDRAARLLQQMGEALAAAHRVNILHRDLKPENVMVCDAGSPEERIKLIDFGIASTHVDQDPTQSTQLAGSPGYLAPERWIGLASCASDVYSLAAIAWEMFTGESYQHGTGARHSTLPPAVAELLTSALAYDPEDRPKDAEAFAREVGQAVSPARNRHVF